MRISLNYFSIFLILFIITLKNSEAELLPSAKQSAWNWIDKNKNTLEIVNKKIWSYAEIGLEEINSSKELQNLLKKNGFTVKAGIAGMPTAFVATFGSSGPRIGILAEFDALPGVSQSTSPEQEPGPNPEAGHACGHSIFGVGSAAAAIALKEAISLGHVKGIVSLYGTPAEETGIGKVYMLKAGYFREDDIILNWHPSDKTSASFSNTKAIVNVKFQFKGSAAHASAMPWSGRSALDAVELMNIGVNFMREHIKPDARIHYVISGGGDQPNVVPPKAEVWYYIRADKFSDVEFYFEWIKEIAESAAQMSQTKLENIEIQSEIHEMIPLKSLANINHKNLNVVGAPNWSNEELKFTRETQLNFKNPLKDNVNEIILSENIEPLPEKAKPARASTDVGDISWFVPTGGLTVSAFGHGLPIHSWPVVASTGTSIGTKALVVAAKVLSATAIDLYANSDLLDEVKSDWIESRGDAPFRTLIPAEQNAPTSIK